MGMDVDSYYTEPYDAKANEALPQSVVYTDAFRELLDHNQKAVALLRDPLVHSNFSDIITNGLQAEIAERTNEEEPEQVMFAVVGDMKAGKSSVINSILSIGTIARKGDGGDSCTWVVQRYMKQFQGQSDAFAAKIRFFDNKQIRDVIASLLTKFCRAANKAGQEYDDEDDDADDQASYVESFGEMHDTVSAFNAMFCDREGFETESATRKSLRQANSENDKGFLRRLVEWAEELVQIHLAGKDVMIFGCATTEGLLWKLQSYTYHIGGMDGAGVPALWPLVAVIDFGLDHPLLNEELHQTPPSMRPQNISVAEIGRAESDAALRTNLELGYRTRGSGKTILVLTHGDEIDEDTEVRGTPAEKAQVSKLNGKIKDLRGQQCKKQHERLNSSPDDRDEIDDELRLIAANIRVYQRERDCCRLEMRNRKVVVKMQELYKGLTSDPRPRPAFAVSNKVYQQYQAGFTAEDRPYISVGQTDIPSLRHRLYMMPVDGKLNEALNFVEVQLPSLVHSVELYCSQVYMARKCEIEAIILEPKTKLRAIVRAALDKLKENVAQTILASMRSREEEWIKEADKICRAWTANYKVCLPLLRNEGYRNGRKGVPEINWNLELMQIGCEWIEDDCCQLEADWTPWVDALATELGKLCMDTYKKIKHDRQYYTMALESFLSSFEIKRRDFSRKMEKLGKRFDRDVKALKERSIHDAYDSYISMVMSPIYDEVVLFKKRGAPAKRCTFIHHEVTKIDGVWSKVHDSMEAAFDELFQLNENLIVKSFGEVFDSIHHDFLLLCDNIDTKDEKQKVTEDLLRNQLKESLVKVKAMVDEGGVIAELAERCKNYSSSQINGLQLFAQ